MDNIFNEIVREIKGHANNAAANAIAMNCLEFGTIEATGLKLDNFKYEIKDYLVLDYLKLDKNNFSSSSDGATVSTPDKLSPLKQEDRVLVATVAGEFIVIGRV